MKKLTPCLWSAFLFISLLGCQTNSQAQSQELLAKATQDSSSGTKDISIQVEAERLAPTIAQSFLQAQMPIMEACFSRLLKATQGAAIFVKAFVRVDDKGRTKGADFKGSPELDKAFKNCLRAQLRKLPWTDEFKSQGLDITWSSPDWQPFAEYDRPKVKGSLPYKIRWRQATDDVKIYQ